MQSAHTDLTEQLLIRIQTLRERIKRDEYLPDAMQVADKFIDLERVLPVMRNRSPLTSG
jgi:anti-sigma28 factor (negative regulator of flagellin synthesis)